MTKYNALISVKTHGCNRKMFRDSVEANCEEQAKQVLGRKWRTLVKIFELEADSGKGKDR